MYRVADRSIHAAHWQTTWPRLHWQLRQLPVLRARCSGSFEDGQRRGGSSRDRKTRNATRSVRGSLSLIAATGICRWTMVRRRSSTLPRRAETDENLGATVTPVVATSSDAPITGLYETIRSTTSLPVEFVSVKSLGVDGPEIGSEVWIRARVATVRVKGKSTFVVLRENSLYTVQACKFKEKEDGGESATAVARFFKSIPLDWRSNNFADVATCEVIPCLRLLDFGRLQNANDCILLFSALPDPGKYRWSLWSSCRGL